MRQDRERRDRLAAEHMDLARAIAAACKRCLPPSIAYEDLLQSGLVGLLQAAERYDPGTGCAFGTYARHVIRGAIFDYVRAAYPMPAAEDSHKHAARCDMLARAEAQTLLNKLPERERVVVEMRMRGETYRAIGARIGVHHTRALQIWERAMRRLREIAA